MRFILVDKILEMEPGKRVRAEKTFSPDQDFFQDHFPGFPVVPGVLLTEMMAQTAGKALDAEKKPRGKAMLVSITKAGFREWMRPGQTAVMSAEIRANRDKYATATCSIEIDGEKICSAELLFSFVSMDKFSADFKDEVLEAYLCGEPI
jgi:3-hydroxyacyl-[acyl-carrier-protein] dehydratase